MAYRRSEVDDECDQMSSDETSALIEPELDSLNTRQTDSSPVYRVANWPQFLAAIVAEIGALVGGLTIGYSAPTIPHLQDDGCLDKEGASWFGSVITLGAAAGGPVAGLLVDYLGRKATIMSIGVPVTVGYLLLATFTSFPLLILARFLTGVGLGMACTSVPTYVAEIATKNLRGVMGSGFQLLITIGVLIAFSVGIVLTWKWLAIFSSAISVVMVILMLKMPETPRWLVSKGRHEEALEALQWLRRNDPAANAELEEIQRCQSIADEESFSVRLFLEPHIYRPLLISMGLMAAQQLSGVNDVVFYTSKIFKDAHWNGDPNIPSVIIALVQVATTMLSCLIVDKTGRRVLLIISMSGMILSSASMGLYYYLSDVKEMEQIQMLSLVSLMVFIFAFSIGLGPIPWLMMSELFPPNVRGPASAIATAFNWLCSFVITKEFSALEDAIHQYGAFWVFTGICILGLLFIIFFVIETKGKTLREIEQEFIGINRSRIERNSPTYLGT